MPTITTLIFFLLGLSSIFSVCFSTNILSLGKKNSDRLLSSAVFPLKGNVYPLGFGFDPLFSFHSFQLCLDFILCVCFFPLHHWFLFSCFLDFVSCINSPSFLNFVLLAAGFSFLIRCCCSILVQFDFVKFSYFKSLSFLVARFLLLSFVSDLSL